MVAALWCVWSALAADDPSVDAALDIERGRVAFELEQYGAARDRAIQALRASPNHPDAHQLYIDATTSAGLGSRGLFELITLEVQTLPSHASAQGLTEAVRDGNTKEIKAKTAQILEDWPNEPDLLLPLWESKVGKVVRLRGKTLSALAHPDALAAADLTSLYRLRRLTVEAGEEGFRPLVEQALEDRGEVRPPPRPPADRLKRSDMALQLSKEQIPAMPWGYPSELVDVGLRLEDLLKLARRFRPLALSWQEIQRISDDPTAWTHEAAAWLEEGDLDRALQVADAAVFRAAGPRNIDLVDLNADRSRADLAAALFVRSRILMTRGDTVRALGEYGAAVLLAGRTLDDAMGEKLEKVNLAAAQSISARYQGSVPASVALSRAARSEDRELVLGILSESRFLAAFGTRGGRLIAEAPDAYAGLFADGYRLEADVEERAGRIEAARTAAVIATVIAGDSRPHWWARRAALHDRNGEFDAAFAAWSVARGLGVRDLERDLERTYVGIADWKVAANNLGGPPPEVAAADVAIASASIPAPRKIRTDRPPSAPRLGEPFPGFSIETGYGNLTNRALQGRVAVLTFFDSRCGECLQMLPAFGSLARRLRREGRDVMVVGVSLDDDPDAFEKVYVRGQGWAELVWAPDLRRPFAVDVLPTTWVIDPEGVARYFVDHWLAVEELETFVRDLD